MSARFRIRTPTGQELSFASLDVFREFVRSGDLSPDDVVYDAETKEWSSARTHPVVLEIELEGEKAAEASVTPSPTGASGGAAPAEPASAPAMEDIGLDLAPAPTQLTPDEEAAAFVAKMEAERAADLTLRDAEPVVSFTMDQSGPASADPVAAAPEHPPPPTPAPHYDEPVRREEPRREESARRYEEPKRRRPAGAARKYAPFLILLVAVGGGAIYFGPELLSPSTRGTDAATDPVAAPPTSAPVIPATDDAIRERARERFLTSTQVLLRGLEPIPQAWLSGRYLASTSDYAYIRDVWQTYLQTVREVRAGDGERYRAAYLRALDDAAVQEPGRGTRLMRGIAEFDARAAARNRHYDRVEALATVAISAHDELVAAEGRILYEPATGPRVSNDPVIEAVGRTPADQALLEEVLDAILAELQGEGSAGSAPRVREWVYGGLLDAVTN